MALVKTFCGKCDDVGTIPIWHLKTIESVRRGDETPLLIECVVACHCKKGQPFRTRKRQGDHVKWLDCFGDKQWHCRRTIRDRTVDGSIFSPRADIDDHGTPSLQSFVRNKPMNYVDSFDAFNEGEL